MADFGGFLGFLDFVGYGVGVGGAQTGHGTGGGGKNPWVTKLMLMMIMEEEARRRSLLPLKKTIKKKQIADAVLTQGKAMDEIARRQQQISDSTWTVLLTEV